MRRRNNQRAVADHIPSSAVDLDLVLGEIGDLSVILLVAGIAEEHDALDLVLESVVEAGDGAVHDCRALAVCTRISLASPHLIPGISPEEKRKEKKRK